MKHSLGIMTFWGGRARDGVGAGSKERRWYQKDRSWCLLFFA